MALQYLLSPTFQFVNTAGKPMTGGAYLEVYVHGTRTKYFCASDFNGTLHPFRIPLDSLGSNIVLAQDGQAYDVYAYNRYGNLMMSRYNITPSSGGGGIGGIIYSSDGSVQVIPTDNGIDLSVNGVRPTVLKVGAAPLGTDGQFVFDLLQVEGEGLSVDNEGRIRMQPGWYHYDVTVELAWEENPRNESRQVSLYTTLSRSVIDIDLSFQHTETIQFSGDVHCVEEGAQMVFGVSGMPTGLVASVIDAGMHSITGKTGDSSRYLAGEGINIDANNYISADLDVVQHKLTAGSNIEIVGNTINATAAPQQQADWAVTDTTSPQYILNKPQLASVATSGSYNDLTNKPTIPAAQVPADWNATSGVSRILNKPDLSVYARSGDLATVATSGSYDDLSDKPTIPAAQVNADWNSNSGVTEILNKPDLGVFARSADLAEVATTGDYDDLVNKPSIPAAQVNADWNSNSGVSQILNKPNLATVATTGNYNDLSGRPSIPAAQVNADWNASSGVAAILNKPTLFSGDYDDLTGKPDLSVYAEKSELATVATSGSYDDLTDKPSIPSFTPTQQAAIDSGVNSTKVGAYDTHVADTTIHVTAADKTAWDGKQDAISDLNTIRSGASAGATAVQPGDLATVATTGNYSDLNGKPTLFSGDYDDLTDKPDLSVYAESADLATVATTGAYSDLSGKPDLSVYAQSSSLATVATTGDYDDLTNKPTIPAAQVNADWNAASGVAQILNKPTLAAVATSGAYADLSGTPTINNVPAVTSSDDNKVLKASYSGGVGSYSWEQAPASQVNSDWTEADPSAASYIENKPVPKALVAGTGISISESSNALTITNTAPDTVASLPTNLTVAQLQAFKEALGVDETLLWSGVALDATLSELPTNFERIRIEYGTPVANTGDNIGRGCIEVSMAFVDTSNDGSIFLSAFFNGDSSNNNPYYTSGFVIGVRTLNWQTAWTAFGQVFGTTKSTGNSWFRLNKIVGIHRIASN